MPTSGLLFYAPLTKNAATAETGQSLTYSSAAEESTIGEIPCLKFDSSNCLYTTNTTGMPIGKFQFTMSVWIYNTDSSLTKRKAFFVGRAALNKGISLGKSQNGTWMYGGYLPDILTGTQDTNTWHHMLETYDGTQYKCYLDGALINTTSYSNLNVDYGGIYIGCIQDLSEKWLGYIAAARFYNRVLEETEITTLASEFTPLAEPTFNSQNISFDNDEGATSKQLSFDNKGKSYSFTITAGTLPQGVIFNGTTGTFTYDGTEIQQDQDYTLTIEIRGPELETTSATVTVQMKVEGGLDYIAYIPLSEYKETAETSQTLTYSNVSASDFKTYANIPCVDMTRRTSQYIRLTESTINQGTSLPRSYSVWLAMTSTNSSHQRGIAIGGYSNGNELCSPNNYSSTWQICAGGFGIDFRTGVNMIAGRWYHFVQQYFADGTLQLYLDGAKIYEGSDKSFDINSTTFSIGCPTASTISYFMGYVADAMLFNRTLEAAEISTLSQMHSPHYTITASNLDFSLYQKNETYSISYSSIMPVTFEIIEGTLPNTISFNTSTGQFTGKGLTDADHTYNLKVRLTADDSDSATVDVTINTYKTARISLSNQTFNFISNKAENFAISYTSDEAVTFSIESGTLPAGMTFSSGRFYAAGTNTSAENIQVVVRATSANNQTGVTATMTLNMQMNAIVCNNQTIKFYTEQGVKSKAVVYAGSLNAVSDAVFAMTGTLPTGVTFDTTTGTFTSDGAQTADETASVSVTVSSSNGTSTSATATITLEVHEGAPAIPEDYVFYAPLDDTSATLDETGNYQLTFNASNATYKGIPCIYTTAQYGMTVNAKPQDFTSSTNKGTWSFWLNIQNSDYIRGIMGGNYKCRIVIVNGDAVLEFTLSDNTSGGHGRFYMQLSLDTWFNIVFTYDGTNLKGYLDGNLISTVGFTSVPTDTDNLALGVRTYSGAPRYYSAFRIYDRVLTDAEIAELASEFTPTT